MFDFDHSGGVFVFNLFLIQRLIFYLILLALSEKEFVIGIQELDSTLTNQMCIELFESIDINNDEEISLIEFLAATLDSRQIDIKVCSL